MHISTLLTTPPTLPGVYVPIGGKKLLTFMDDFNMPAKDTFGSQPPLELIRQWIDYGFFYDRQKQIIKQIRVCAPMVMFSASWLLLHLGNVPVGSHGSPWWREDGDIQEATEQVQPDQYDFSTGMVPRVLLNLGRSGVVRMFWFVLDCPTLVTFIPHYNQYSSV